MPITDDPIRIIEVKDGKALIRAPRLSMCAHCHAEDEIKNKSIFETWIDNPVGAKPGDFVHVEMAPKKFLLGIFVLFGVPLIGLFLGIAAASWVHFFNPLARQIALGFFGYALSYIIVWRFDKYALKSNKFIPAAIKKIRIKEDFLNKPVG
ncbi:MAG: SoxR reducing system RseC family protein [candidate division KSB1 bacterium]|nr:SoxR reducing system RseC family protein [candidate division KSB1 bacterium]MDZ7402295.1 SoxR reducing system RseC family protein [candidate division KSB1 bacterium]